MYLIKVANIKQFAITSISVLVLAVSLPAIAQVPAEEALTAPTQDKGTIVDILPAKSLTDTQASLINTEEATHPPIRLTPDKSELIRLDAEAASVIIGSPDHVSVMAESAKTLVLVPRTPGATYVTILGHQGQVLMQRHIIVASPKEKYVRVRRSCAGAGDAPCQETRVYYCPDMCHEINVSQGPAAASASIDDKIKDVVKDINKAADEGQEEAEQENTEETNSEE